MQEFFLSLSGMYGLALFILGLGFLIFIHELGHFAVAKMCGIKVEKFAIGFDPWGLKICAFTYGETKYLIGAIPLGGYVKMLGQDDTNVKNVSEDPRSYTQKSYSQRMAVISAGVIMNMIFGAIFLIVAFMMGVQFPSNVVGSVNPSFPAATAQPVGHDGPLGIQVGDRIVEINGEKIEDWGDIRISTALKNPNSPLEITVQRPTEGDQYETLKYKSDSAKKDPNQESLKIIGVTPISALETFPEKLTLRRLAPDYREEYLNQLKENGLRPGMKITAIDGKPITQSWQVERAIQQAGLREITFTFSDDQGSADLKVNTQAAFVTKVEPIKINGTVPEKVSKRKMAFHFHILGIRPPLVVAPGAEAQKAAANGLLKDGDIFKQIGDHPWPSHHTLVEEAHKNTSVKFVIIRDGEEMELSITANKNKFGIAAVADMSSNIIAGVLPESPLSKAEVLPRPGSKIISVNGTPINNYSELQQFLFDSDTTDFTLKFSETLDGKEVTEDSAFVLTPEDRAKMTWMLADFFPQRDMHKIEFKSDGPIEGLTMGLEKTWDMVVLTYVSLLRLVDGNVPVTSARGPVRMAASGSVMADQGFAYFLFFLGMISINLAVINFLPLPILDGGHAVFLTLEKIMGKPVPLAVQAYVTYAGLILIGGFFLFVFFNDIYQLTQGRI